MHWSLSKLWQSQTRYLKKRNTLNRETIKTYINKMWRGETKAGKISMGRPQSSICRQDLGKNIAKKIVYTAPPPENSCIGWSGSARAQKKNKKTHVVAAHVRSTSDKFRTLTNPTLNTICKNLTSAKLVCAMMKFSLPSMAHVTHAFPTSWIERTVKLIFSGTN